MEPRSTRSYNSFKKYKSQKSRWFSLLKNSKLKLVKTRRVVKRSVLQPGLNNRMQNFNKKKSYRNQIILFSLLFLTATWLSLMIYLPYFSLNKIIFNGLEIINQEEIENYIKNNHLNGSIIPGKNFFICNTNKIEKDLKNKYAIDSIEINKVFPNQLEIFIVEKISSIIYYNGSSYSLLDIDGTAIDILSFNEASTSELSLMNNIVISTSSDSLKITTSTIDTTSTTIYNNKFEYNKVYVPDYGKLNLQYGNRLPILYDSRHKAVVKNQLNILPKYFIDAILEWQSAIEEKQIGVIKYFTVSNYEAGAIIYLNKKWNILIQPKNSIEQQLYNLEILLSNSDVIPTEYINLCFGERVFWK